MRRDRLSYAARLAVIGGVFYALALQPATGQGWNVELIGQIGGPCEAVYVQGNYAYIGQGAHLAVVDISNPSRPISVGRILLPDIDIVWGVFVSGSLAYVADGTSGLKIVDISDPSSPQLRGSYDTPGNALDVWISGMLACVADGYSGLQLIDVTNPRRADASRLVRDARLGTRRLHFGQPGLCRRQG